MSYGSYDGKSMAPGGGGRFAKLEDKLAHRPGVTNPAGLAAAIGRRMNGQSKMTKWSKEGEHRAEGHK